MIADQFIEGPYDDYPGKNIPIIVEIGKEVDINGKQKTRGMVRFGKEPQQMYNYWASVETELLALAPKAPYLATPKMILNHKSMWDKANVTNFNVLLYDYDPEAPGGRPVREMPPQMSSGMIAVKESMQHDIMSAMGLYEASLGDDAQEKSGKAIIARQRQGNIGSTAYTDNFVVSLIFSAKILIDLIPKVYSEERMIRIRGESGAGERVIPINARPDSPLITNNPDIADDDLVKNEVTPYINDLSIGKYDVVATVGQSYTTQREEALEILINLVEKIPQLGVAAPDLIVGLLDMPMSEELMERVKKMVPPELRDPDPNEPPPDEEMPSAEEMIKMKETEIKHREQLRKDFETQINALWTIAKAEAEEVGQQINEYKLILEDIKLGMDQVNQTQGSPDGPAQGA